MKNSIRHPHRLRCLTAADRSRVTEHLLSLPTDDRRLRFGHGSIEPILRYCDTIDFSRDVVLGADAANQLCGLAHVPLSGGVAELGISVAPDHRHRYLGLALAKAALERARSAGAQEFRFEFLPSNAGMRRIAHLLGMTIEREGTELAARLQLSSAEESAMAA